MEPSDTSYECKANPSRFPSQYERDPLNDKTESSRVPLDTVAESRIDSSNASVSKIDEPSASDSESNESNGSASEVDESNVSDSEMDESNVSDSEVDEPNASGSVSDELNVSYAEVDEWNASGGKIVESKAFDDKVGGSISCGSNLDETNVCDYEIIKLNASDCEIDELIASECGTDESNTSKSEADERNVDNDFKVNLSSAPFESKIDQANILPIFKKEQPNVHLDLKINQSNTLPKSKIDPASAVPEGRISPLNAACEAKINSSNAASELKADISDCSVESKMVPSNTYPESKMNTPNAIPEPKMDLPNVVSEPKMGSIKAAPKPKTDKLIVVPDSKIESPDVAPRSETDAWNIPLESKVNPPSAVSDSTVDPTSTASSDLICDLCRFGFSTSLALSSHECSRSAKKKWTCHSCVNLFSQKYKLVQHLGVHTGKRLFCCKVCDKIFALMSSLQKHLKCHKELKCKGCNKFFALKSSFIEHLKSHKELKRCKECNKAFAKKSSLKRHVKRHKKLRRYVCRVCGKCCSTERMFQKHIVCCKYNRHAVVALECVPQDDKLRRSSQTKCDFQSADGIEKLENRCFENTYFRSKLLQSSEHGIDRDIYKCELCCKTFSSRDDLKIHLSLHLLGIHHDSDRRFIRNDDLEQYHSELCKRNDSSYSSYLNNTDTFQNPRNLYIGEKYYDSFKNESGRSFAWNSTGNSSVPVNSNVLINRSANHGFQEMGTVGSDFSLSGQPGYFPNDMTRSHSSTIPVDTQKDIFCADLAQNAYNVQNSRNSNSPIIWRNRAVTNFPLQNANNSVMRHLNFGNVPQCTVNKPFLATSNTFDDHRSLPDASQASFNEKSYKLENNLHKNINEKYSCNICGENFLTHYEMKNHALIHTRKRSLYTCNQCHKRCKTKEGLASHVSEVHTKQHNHAVYGNISKEMHLCNICGKKFPLDSELDIHVLQHLKNKPFSCDQCSKRFKYEVSLVSHVSQVHTGEKNHASVSDTLSHSHKNAVRKRYNCSICSDRFLTIAQLKSHALKHLKSKRFMCDECSKLFKSKASLEAHVVAVHGNKQIHVTSSVTSLSVERSNGQQKIISINEKSTHEQFICAEQPISSGLCKRTKNICNDSVYQPSADNLSPLLEGGNKRNEHLFSTSRESIHAPSRNYSFLTGNRHPIELASPFIYSNVNQQSLPIALHSSQYLNISKSTNTRSDIGAFNISNRNGQMLPGYSAFQSDRSPSYCMAMNSGNMPQTLIHNPPLSSSSASVIDKPARLPSMLKEQFSACYNKIFNDIMANFQQPQSVPHQEMWKNRERFITPMPADSNRAPSLSSTPAAHKTPVNPIAVEDMYDKQRYLDNSDNRSMFFEDRIGEESSCSTTPRFYRRAPLSTRSKSMNYGMWNEHKNFGAPGSGSSSFSGSATPATGTSASYNYSYMN